MVSHEFQVPLTTALMLIDLVLNVVDNDFCTRYLKAIQSTLNLCLSLVSDMLDLKMIKEGKFILNKNIFNPLDTIKFII